LIGLSPMFAKLGLPKQCPNVPNWHVYKCTNIGRGREREREWRTPLVPAPKPGKYCFYILLPQWVHLNARQIHCRW
jgi:ribosomal protein L39E